MEEDVTRKPHLIVPVAAALAVALALLAGWYFLAPGAPGAHPGTEVVSPIPLSGTTSAEALADTSEAPPEGYVQYVNNKYRFSFYHSPEGKITEYDEGGGAETIVLENFQKVRGLQVFIVPYAGDTISDQRFHDDVPSGVRKNIEMTTIGAKQIPAVTFQSEDALLGPTREIWFIYEEHLYEITTFQGVKDWLTPIIQSWRFTD